MRTPFLIAFLFTAMATVANAKAEESDAADLRCMAVMAKINQLPDPRHQLESLIGGYYYLGRLNAARPSMDLPLATAEAFGLMSASQFLTETARCEKEMQDKGKSMSGIAAAMPKIQEKPKAP